MACVLCVLCAIQPLSIEHRPYLFMCPGAKKFTPAEATQRTPDFTHSIDMGSLFHTTRPWLPASHPTSLPRIHESHTMVRSVTLSDPVKYFFFALACRYEKGKVMPHHQTARSAACGHKSHRSPCPGTAPWLGHAAQEQGNK